MPSVWRLDTLHETMLWGKTKTHHSTGMAMLTMPSHSQHNTAGTTQHVSFHRGHSHARVTISYKPAVSPSGHHSGCTAAPQTSLTSSADNTHTSPSHHNKHSQTTTDKLRRHWQQNTRTETHTSPVQNSHSSHSGNKAQQYKKHTQNHRLHNTQTRQTAWWRGRPCHVHTQGPPIHKHNTTH